MEAKRKTVRASINGRRNKLTITGKEPGFEYRIVNDSDDRILELQERGYEVVTHDASVGDKRVGIPKKEGSPIEISVGGGKKAYLMRIKKEWYDEDQAAKMSDIDATEDALKKTSDSDYGKVEINRK
jgi:hypothetical protein